MTDEAPTATGSSIDVKWKGAEQLREHLVPIHALKPFPGNAMKGQAHIDRIAESLLRFGQVRAVLVRDDQTIVAGHHVWKAAQHCGWSHLAAIPAEFDTYDDSRDYLVADNQLARLTSPKHVDQVSLLDEIAAKGSFEGTGFTREEYEDLKAVTALQTEKVRIDSLKEHEDNYKEHPPEQIAHIAASLKQHGIYRNVVVANDGTILAGHGIVLAAKEIGLKHIPIQRLEVAPDHPDALKVMAGDNELGRLAEMDDRALTEALKKVVEEGDVESLLGTGYDAQTLANLIFVSRPASEIKNHDAAAEWIGLPEFEPQEQRLTLTLSFDTEEDRAELIEWLPANSEVLRRVTRGLLPEEVGVTIVQKRPTEGGARSNSAWWPARPKQDLASLRFE